jgi:hypothetical protein
MSTKVNPTAICLPIVQFFMNPSDFETKLPRAPNNAMETLSGLIGTEVRLL